MPVTEKIKKIAIQGYEGSYHQMAVEKFYARPVDLLECASFRELTASAIDAEKCDEAVMAIENSIVGSILPNYNLIVNSGLQIIGEVYLPIHHQLMVLPGTSLEDVQEIYSHPMALLQCSAFLDNLPNVKITDTDDTALSAKIIAQQRLTTTAAIASKRAAELYNLDIILSSIEDDTNNYTRFLVLSREPSVIDDSNKASLTFKLEHKPGSLSAALETIARLGINISKLQSVPIIGKQWQYAFHIDVEFDHLELLDKMCADISAHCVDIKILGIYKKGIL